MKLTRRDELALGGVALAMLLFFLLYEWAYHGLR